MTPELVMHDSFVNRECNNETVGMEFESMKTDASKLMHHLDWLMGASPSTARYTALAKTALEESVMWATKSIALGELNRNS